MPSSRIIALVSLLAATVLVSSPSLPDWGEFHAPHADPKNLLLPFGQFIGQTFTSPYSYLDTIVIWLDPALPWQKTGDLKLTLNSGPTSFLSLADIPSTGTAAFHFKKPVRVASPASFTLALTEPGQQVALRYQIDASIYSEGTLLHSDPKKQGDLAFQIRYLRPALGNHTRQWGYAVAIAAAGFIVAFL